MTSSLPRLDGLLERALEDQTILEEVTSVILGVQHRLELCSFGRPATRALRPQVISRACWERAAAAAGSVARVMRGIATRLAASPELQDRAGFDQASRWLFGVDRSGADARLMARTDGLFDADGRYRVLEHNMGFAGGGSFADGVGDLFEQTRLLGAVPGSLHRQKFADGLADAMRTTCGRTPVLGFVTPFDVELSMLAQLGNDSALIPLGLREQRFEVVSGEVKHLTVDDRVRLKGVDVDVLLVIPIVGVIHDAWSRLREAGPHLDELMATGRFRFFNGISVPHAGYPKSLLALMDDPAAEAVLEGLDGEDVVRCREAVPWTRVVAEGPVEWQGRRHDLLDLLARERERFVLKPSFGFGGRGVVLGWATSQEVWEARIRCEDEVLVAQERVDGVMQRWPILDDRGSPTWVETPASVDVFVWNDQRAGASLSRLMVDGLMNISQGSSVVPVYVHDP